MGSGFDVLRVEGTFMSSFYVDNRHCTVNTIKPLTSTCSVNASKNNKDVSKCLAEVSFKRLGSMPCDGALLLVQIHTRLVSELIGFGGSRSGICGSFVACDFRVWGFGVLGQSSSSRVWQGV